MNQSVGSELKTLYPELSAYESRMLDVGGDHMVYFEQSGNPEGLPVLFLHGGPGSGCKEGDRRFFNPDKYRIIIFDQRACHRSTPSGRIKNNTTRLLLDDMESIRKELNIPKWFLFGGSWGATLALLYAEYYPQRVNGMSLRGTFLARQCDFDWFTDGVVRIFPDYWEEFLSVFSVRQRKNWPRTMLEGMFGNDQDMRLKIARAWGLWSGRVVMHNMALPQPYAVDSDDIRLINQVMIEAHYAGNKYFLSENYILKNIAAIPDVPITIIHGRYDLTCLPEASWLLHQHLPNSKLIMLPAVGHLSSEPTMVDALVSSTDDFV